MARIHCRWKRVLLCLCTLCLCVLLALLYVFIMVLIAINKHVTSPQSNGGTVSYAPERAAREPPVHFIAPGARKTKKYSPTPKVFWSENYDLAFWNKLQKEVDLNVNRPANSELGPLGASLISHSHSELSLSLPEQLQNYVSSMSRRSYPVLMEPRGHCGVGAAHERGPLLLLAIKTSVHNYRNRQAIRKSWGRAGWMWEERGAYVHRVFLMGTEHSPELRDISTELLHLESHHYGDILQWDVWDTPQNGTVRQLLFWSWFRDTCGHISFVFEADDEVFVNTPALVSLLQEQLLSDQADSSLEEFMMGHVEYRGQPNRSSDSQEFIPKSFYRGWYPSYTRGAGRLYSAQLLRRLLEVSYRLHLFPIEQVYVGMCLIRLNLSPSHHPAFLPSDWTKEREEQPCAAHGVLLLQTHSSMHMMQLWDSLSTNSGRCANVTVAPVTVKKTIVTAGEMRHGF